MFGLRTVFHILGWVTCMIGIMLVLPAFTDLAYDNADWRIFALSSCLPLFFGTIMVIATYSPPPLRLNFRQAYLVIILGWLLVAALGAIPFLGLGIRFVDALFESMSGLTTTGSTILTGLDSLPPGMLLWRATLQWIGGIGIIAISVLIMPFLRVGGMQLFQVESSDPFQDRIGSMFKTLRLLVDVYLVLTLACALTYFFLGMSGFDAVTHAMTTLSTGGFSTHDASFAYFKNPWLHWAAGFFMICGAIPFLLYVKLSMGHVRELLRDAQVRGFLLFLAFTSLAMALWLMAQRDIGFFKALTLTFFNVVSVVTTTGFASEDYTVWGTGAVGVFLFLMFVGGCAGSTSGAIKIYRFQIMLIFLRRHIRQLFSPNRILSMRYNGRELSHDVPLSVLVFLSAFVVTVSLVTIVLSLLGLDIVTAYSASITAITNVGPGLGKIIGPSGNFQSLPDAAKGVLVFAMLAGRLEILGLLVVLEPDFWRG